MPSLNDREWGRFRIGNLFEKLPLKRIKKTFDKKKDLSKVQTVEFNLPLINAKVGDNGIMYYGREKDWESVEMTIDIVNDGAVSTGMVYAQPQRTGTLYNAYQIRLRKISPTYRQLLFLQQCLQKNIQLKFDYYNKATWDNKVENETILLPLISQVDPKNYSQSDIDWQFMEEFIEELEIERIQELKEYLIATRLNDYHLSDDEKVLLDYKPQFKPFKLASTYFMRGKKVAVDENGIFDIISTKKKINANSVSFDGQYPYVARGESKNGIRGYINFDENYLNPENTISFGQDTATMYYQSEPYFTGDKIQIFQLNKKFGILNENTALYIISSMKKAFANFSWGQQSFALDAISVMNIELPVDNKGDVDFEYMDKYVQIIKKLAIIDVVQFKDDIIENTRKVII